ncbi:rab11 family-interacting protein 1 isoform X3 [Hemicordylus capensis]|uniref:rab11 family-interacting protein 1 isoform X3 n=1 Tax=Hemicordylus capensis TaxID=884348 RepID=UPI00230271C1|nr:rab11 family-interacting protein 1 isoform X3 [Hemicordylus capensis]
MSLPGSPLSGGPRWAPTHVQVTVLQARGLRPKAKSGSGGGSDAYAVMALGKEKFATSVAERCLGSPVWREEATFELPPPPRRGLVEVGPGPLAVLQLTVLHRALLGLDKFLGRAEISLAELQQTEGGRRTTRWYKLHSKPGKKEKERGEIEVDVQFMRSNMTASMFDLSMKDKSRTPFGKLKDKLKGKRGNGLPDTASAIVPSITHSPADSEEESNEKEKEKKKSKFKTLFSKPGLRKSNVSQSMSVLPTLQPVSERVRLRPSDFQSQWSDEDDEDTLTPVSERKKETKASEEIEHIADASPKPKEVKRNERELAKKEATLFGDAKRDTGPEKSSAGDVPVVKASLNPFIENMEEGKPEKNAASVKPSQTKPVKPRLGVSSEDETKAALTVSVPLAPPFCPSSKLDPELKSHDFDSVASPSLNLSKKHNSKPFAQKLRQESKEQGPECFATTSSCLPTPTSGKKNNPFSPLYEEPQIEDSENSITSPLYLPHLPKTSVLELHPQPSNVDDSFVSKLEQNSEYIHSPPTPLPFPSAVSIQESASSVGSLVEPKNLLHVPSDKPQHEGLTNQTGPIASSPGSLSGSHSVCFYDRVGLILNTQRDDKEVNVVTPFKENNGATKKSVTFALDELKVNNSASSGDEVSFEDSVERWHDENEDAIDPAEKNRRRTFELDTEHCSVSKFHDGKINSAYNSGTPLERETETSYAVEVGPPVPAPRVLLPSPKETNLSRTVLSGSSLSVPPKPAPRNAQNPKRFVADEAEIGDATSSASELELPVDNSAISSEKLTRASSLAISVSTTLHPEREDGTVDSSQNINNDHSSYAIGTQSGTLVTCELSLKPRALPVILEVGSDDEQLNGYQKDSEKLAVSEDLSKMRENSAKLWASIEERELASDDKVAGERQTLLLGEMTDPDDAFEPKKSSVNIRGVQNAGLSIKGSEQKDEDCFTENRQGDCPEFSNKPVALSPLSNASELCSAGSFQSEFLSSNRAESLKNTTVESSDAKVEISGRKKLLQARVSPSETHPNQTLQSGGTYPAKLRLHPVKPMNTTTNKLPSKTLGTTTKILDNQNEINLKKYNPSDPAYAYAQLTHDELIQMVLKQKDVIAKRDVQVRELEDYIDNLLVRVMEETPNILRVQAHANKKAGKM